MPSILSCVPTHCLHLDEVSGLSTKPGQMCQMSCLISHMPHDGNDDFCFRSALGVGPDSRERIYTSGSFFTVPG